MLWLLDRDGLACIISDAGGLAKALDESGVKETPQVVLDKHHQPTRNDGGVL